MPSLLPKRRQRIPTIVLLYRPILRHHQLIVKSSGPLVAVVVPPVALLPLVVIMLPVEAVVHSVALLPLAAVVSRRHAAHCRRVPPVAIVVPPIEVCSLHRHVAGSAFVIAPPLPSLLRRRSLHCHTTAAFIIAAADCCMVLPSSSRRRCLPCRAAAAAFLVAPVCCPSLLLCARQSCCIV